MNEKIARIKKHVNDHKKVYLIAGAVVTVGAAAGAGYILGTRTVPKEISTQVAPSQTAALCYKPMLTQTVEVTVEALGDPGNIIQDLTTGTIYASQNQAAKALGVYPARISEHLAGKIPNVQGHMLQFLGKAAVA